MSNSDKYGDALRKYYKSFGMANEGPPDDLNITELVPIIDFEDDIELIERICNNKKDFKKHQECKDLVEFIAGSLGDSKFMNEILDSVSEPMESENLTNGIFWHYLATILDPRIGKLRDVNISFPGDLPEVKQELLKVQGSLIFRLYITLVFMKEGPLEILLNQSSKKKNVISGKANKLIKCDYVRHLRNALSHSTFKSTSFGIYFSDENKFETVGSPDFLNSLTSWIMLLNFQCSTVVDLINEKVK